MPENGKGNYGSNRHLAWVETQAATRFAFQAFVKYVNILLDIDSILYPSRIWGWPGGLGKQTRRDGRSISMANSFNVRKAAQVVTYFAKAEGGSINVLKLVKIIYLADRKFMEKYDATILNDRFVSMEYGPVNSMTLNYINGCQEDRENWEAFVSDRAVHHIGLTNPDISDEDFDELSDAEVEILAEIWGEFGSLSQYQVRDFTHENCLEWEDPNGSSNPIPYERVFKFLGKKDSLGLAKKIESEKTLDSLFAAE